MYYIFVAITEINIFVIIIYTLTINKKATLFFLEKSVLG